MSAERSFERSVEASERRKQRARRSGDELLSWFGTFGLVGWSIALPSLLGVALGLWLDARYEQDYSYTLALMLAGLVLGCLLAWYWVRRESRA